MVVIPYGGGRLTKFGQAVVTHGHRVGIVIIPIHARIDHKGWVAIRVSGVVPTVQMDRFPLGDGRHARIPGKVVPVAHHYRLAHPCFEGGARHGAVVSIDFSGHLLIGPIQHHLLPGPLPLGIPGHHLARAVVRIVCACYIAIKELWCNPPIDRLGGIHILIKSW